MLQHLRLPVLTTYVDTFTRYAPLRLLLAAGRSRFRTRGGTGLPDAEQRSAIRDRAQYDRSLFGLSKSTMYITKRMVSEIERKLSIQSHLTGGVIAFAPHDFLQWGRRV